MSRDPAFDFTIDADIRRAETLPAACYHDAAFYAAGRERVFAPSWQYLAPASAAKMPRTALPVGFLDGCIDEPLLLVRGDDDQLRCLSNVCTHRGALVVPQPCRAAAHLRCPYHGRRFGLDGAFEAMPEFEDAEGFPTAQDDLRTMPCHTWGPMVFAAIEPVIQFEALFAPVDRLVGHLPLDAAALDPSRSRDYLVGANWAAYCDNYLEGFHIPFVHTSLEAIVDYGAYRTDLFDHGNVQVGISRGGEHLLPLPDGHPDRGTDVSAYWFWLFPNLMINVYPWGISLNVVKPLGPERTKVSFLSFVWDETKLARGAGAELDRVEREDETVVEWVQRGVQSRVYRRGRYSPTREQGVHQFHRMLARAVCG